MPLMRDLLLNLLSFVFFFSVSLEVYAVEKEAWSAQKAQNLITRINTREDIEAFYEFGRAMQNCLVSPSQRSQLKITALPQKIYDGHNDMKATWFFIMVLNGYTDFITPLEELSSYDPLARTKLGCCYELGNGVVEDLEKAFKLYGSAADQGLAEAQFKLGWCYEYGKGVAVDLEKAIELFTSAANQGYAEAQTYLGWCYQLGKDVGKDLEKAFKLYASAADQGYAEAQSYLGDCFKRGRGVTKDLGKAIQLYKLAATQGNASAYYDLGLCYEKGEGIDENLLEAVRSYIIAVFQGSECAFDRLTPLIEFCSTDHMQEDISSEIMDSISILKGNLEDLLNDTFYWAGFSQNTSFKDAVVLMPVLYHKATALSQFYQSMLSLLPLLKRPDFAITCFKIQNKKLEEYLETYQNSNKYYFSFDSTYQNFKKGYEAKKTAALTLIAEMNLGLEKAAHFITLPACEVPDHLDQLKRGENLELVQFIEPMLYPYIKASTLQEQDQARINLQRFINDFTTRLVKHKMLFTDLGEWEGTDLRDQPMAYGFVNYFKGFLSLFKLNEASSPTIIDFKEVFEDLIVKTAPYRNHLFTAKHLRE